MRLRCRRWLVGELAGRGGRSGWAATCQRVRGGGARHPLVRIVLRRLLARLVELGNYEEKRHFKPKTQLIINNVEGKMQTITFARAIDCLLAEQLVIVVVLYILAKTKTNT